VAIVAGSRASIRRQVGRTLYPRLFDFLYGATSAAAGTTFTLDTAKIVPDDSLVGRLAYFADGTALGQLRVITDNVQSTGVVTVSPAFSPAPTAGDTVEIWPDYIDIETVNDHINLAIDRISEAVGIYVESTATVAADGITVTLPGTLTHVVGVRYQDGYGMWWDYFPSADPWQDTLGPYTLAIRGGFVYLNHAIPDSTFPVYIRGYRAPAYMTADADLADVNPAYLVYMTAYSLSAGMSYGQALDPEQHSARATNWYNQAKDIELKSQTNWLPHTVPVNT
jgi:hypothetical protein